MTTTIHNHIDIAATPEQVWDVLADLDRLHESDPVVTRSALVGGQREGVGAQRRCDARQGRYFVETVTEWDQPNPGDDSTKTDQGIKGFLAGLSTTVTNAHPSTTT